MTCHHFSIRPESHHFLLHAADDPRFPNECPGTPPPTGSPINFEARKFKDNGRATARIGHKF
jgi:hypothetical protein